MPALCARVAVFANEASRDGRAQRKQKRQEAEESSCCDNAADDMGGTVGVVTVVDRDGTEMTTLL